ncbi:MAG: helicase C-terminal domain-containing protein [Candidatus Caldarchaeales archaeon]|jgi:DNA excision repair protein ERCC-2
MESSKHVVIEAPTGLGKTAATWSAVKAFAEEKRLRILWLTRTASQVRHVASETGAVPVYGRKLLCLHEVISKIDQRRFNQACRATRQAGRCPYYPGRPRAMKVVTIGDLKSAGAKTITCPYEIQLLNLSASTALVATHRQLALVGWLLAKWRWSREKTILVLDEGQHIVQEALSMIRDSIPLKTVAKAASEAEKYGFRELANMLREAVEYYGSLLNSDGEIEVEDRLPDYEEMVVAGEEIQEKKLRENYAPASHVLSLADFKASLAKSKPLLVREGKSIRLEAIADPQEVLQRIYSGWARTVTLSATISAELLEAVLGEEVTLLRAGWPYGDNLKAMVVTGLTTKYEKRDEKMIEDIRWLLALATRKGERALVFLPSFDILEAVKGENVLYEDRALSQEAVDGLISEFSSGNKPLVAVYNGRLGEGIDLSAPLVFLVGVPFSPPTARTTKLLKRLSEIVGDEGKAKLYGVILPGLWSALQAAGRAIRGPEDSADVYLIDDRYRTMVRLLPR